MNASDDEPTIFSEMDLANMNNFPLTEATTSPLQNVTFLSNVFMMTFFTALGFNTLNSVIGE